MIQVKSLYPDIVSLFTDNQLLYWDTEKTILFYPQGQINRFYLLCYYTSIYQVLT